MKNAELISDQSFPAWAFSAVERLRKAVGIGALLVAAVSIKNLEPGKWLSIMQSGGEEFLKTHAQDRANLALIQAAACFLLAILTPKPSVNSLARRKHMSKPELAIANKACQRIQSLVMASYIAWSVYYLITSLTLPLISQHGMLDTLDRIFSINLNIIPSLLLFWLYLELAELTVVEPSRKGIKKGESVKTEEELLDDSNAAFHRILSLGVVGLIVAPAWYAFGRDYSPIITASEVASSCLNGVALALVVGRLGSKIIDPGSITLGLLYFYAVIQPTAAIFHENPAAHLFATTVALPLKILLWLVIVWAFTTGILSEYVHDIRLLLTKENKIDLSDE